MSQEILDLTNAMNDATNAIASGVTAVAVKLQSLLDTINAGLVLTDAEKSAFNEHINMLTSISSQLETLASDPQNPIV